MLATGLSACQTVVVQESAGEEDLTLRVVCQSPEVYQLYYTLYLDGEEYCQGGWGDIDGDPLTGQSDLTALFPQGYFEGRDLSGLAVDLSPYGRGIPRRSPPPRRWSSQPSTADAIPSSFPGMGSRALPPRCKRNDIAPRLRLGGIFMKKMLKVKFFKKAP